MASAHTSQKVEEGEEYRRATRIEAALAAAAAIVRRTPYAGLAIGDSIARVELDDF